VILAIAIADLLLDVVILLDAAVERGVHGQRAT
jgi:hypothetical protein